MIFNFLLALVPLSWGLAYFHTPQLWVFVVSAAAIMPLADWIRRATEQMTARAGPAVGGLLNVTFGNMAELILALFVLSTGHTQVVKASITGSIIGNGLLGLGLAILFGSWGRDKQTFSRARAGQWTSLLMLCVIGLMLPALFSFTERGLLHVTSVTVPEESLSLGVSSVLILVYIANLIYTLVTHRDVFAGRQEEKKAEWSLWKAFGVLIAATAAVAIESDLVSNALDATVSKLGLTPFFLGIIVLPFIGNAAELVSAVYFARKDRMGLAMGVTVGSGIQIALLTAPLLVLISFVIGHPMNLVFSNPLELIAIAGTAFVVNSIAQDGETTWFEGLLLVAVYVLLALTFFFVTP